MNPPVYPIGCAGRITQFSETDDGRYLITLTGVSRFRIREELPLLSGYRNYLIELRGFAPSTVAQHMTTSSTFIARAVPSRLRRLDLSAAAVERFVAAEGHREAARNWPLFLPPARRNLRSRLSRPLFPSHQVGEPDAALRDGALYDGHVYLGIVPRSVRRT